MIIPITPTTQSPPLANWMLVGLTSIVGLTMWASAGLEPSLAQDLVLQRGDGFRPIQLIGHLFIHEDPWHLLWNMLLLIGVGNAVNARIGNLMFMVLYLALGALAGWSWLLFADGVGALGSSGAVAGMLGVFLVLQPLSRTLVGVWVLGLVLAGYSLVWSFLVGEEFGLPYVLSLIPLVGLFAFASIHSGLSASGVPREGWLLRLAGFRTPTTMAGYLFFVLFVGADVVAVFCGAVDGVGHWAHLGGALGGVLITGVLVALGVIARHDPSERSPTLLHLFGWLPTPAKRANPILARVWTTQRSRALTVVRHRRILKTFSQWANEVNRIRGTT